MKTLISFFSSNLSEIIATLWLLNFVFFIYAMFDKSKTGNNDLIIISLFWCMLNFYATGVYIACDISKRQSSTVCTNSSSSFVLTICRLEQCKSHTDSFLKTYTKRVSLRHQYQCRLSKAVGGCHG